MRIMTFVGARPQFVKAAVLRSLFPEYGIEELLVHTGQHYDHIMSQAFFEQLRIRDPDFKIDLNQRSHGAMTGEIITGAENLLLQENPDYCLIYGDTNSTLAAALAASKIGIPIIHVEAGLRSFNKAMPEEVNRIVADHVSDLLFCSTHASVQNLINENISQGVHHVGDIMYDAVKLFANANDAPVFVQDIKASGRQLAIVTIHRQDTLQSPERLGKILEFCQSFADDYDLVLTAHPRTASVIRDLGLNLGVIRMVEPFSYLEMQGALSLSDLVLTDSGGLQKEAYFHQAECITLRDETEWVETITHGWNRLWANSHFEAPRRAISEYGQGDCGAKMIELIKAR